MSAQPPSVDSPSPASVLRRAIDNELAGVHISFPARVVDYDSSDQTVTVTPQIRLAFRDIDGNSTYESLPTIYDVPVCFPRAGSFGLTFPLEAGDFVLCVVSSRDLGPWRESGQPASGDQRPYQLSGAVAIPGVFPAADALDASGSHMIVGDHSGSNVTIRASSGGVELDGAAAAIARADRVEAELNVLKSAISDATTVPMDGGASFKTKLLAALAAWPGSTGCDKVRGT